MEHWVDYEHSSTRFYVKNRIDGLVPWSLRRVEPKTGSAGMRGLLAMHKKLCKETSAGLGPFSSVILKACAQVHLVFSLSATSLCFINLVLISLKLFYGFLLR